MDETVPEPADAEPVTAGPGSSEPAAAEPTGEWPPPPPRAPGLDEQPAPTSFAPVASGLGWPAPRDGVASGAPEDPWRAPEVLEAGPAASRRWPGASGRWNGAVPLLVVALVAGLVGGLLGSWAAIRHDEVRRIDLGAAPLTSPVRASGGLSAIAAHTLPSVVSVQVSTHKRGDTGSGLAISGS
ncbi:MAG: hypothetical protein ACTHMW_07030 [Actinomycetes bacterium]